MLDFETNQTLHDAFTLWLLVLKQGNIEVLLEFLFLITPLFGFGGCSEELGA